MSGYWQLSFDLGPLDPDAAEAHCFDLGATSVTFVDAHDDPVLEPLPGEFRLWPSTRVRTLFPGDEDPVRLTESLAAALDILPAGVQAERIEDRVWEREWLRDFHSMRFGSRLWICPRHAEIDEPGAVIVRMDPGLAFGTGTHPTTALCLEWLDGHLLAGERVIDYGCGSGILAVAAARLGAREAHCFDIDPQALTAARENAAVNGVSACVLIHESAATLPRDVDLLLANILSGPLCELAAGFASMVRPGGRVVLAGLLAHELADVTEAYSAWFDIRPFEVREGWAGLAGNRITHAP